MLYIQIVDILPGVSRKELLLIEQTERQPFKTLKKSFDIVLTRLTLAHRKLPMENISGIRDLFFFHVLVIAPETGLDEMDFHLLLMLVLNRKPNIAITVQFIHKFE